MCVIILRARDFFFKSSSLYLFTYFVNNNNNNNNFGIEYNNNFISRVSSSITMIEHILSKSQQSMRNKIMNIKLLKVTAARNLRFIGIREFCFRSAQEAPDLHYIKMPDIMDAKVLLFNFACVF